MKARFDKEFVPIWCEQIGRYKVYELDTTPDERPEAETLDERVLLKAQKSGALVTAEADRLRIRSPHPPPDASLSE